MEHRCGPPLRVLFCIFLSRTKLSTNLVLYVQSHIFLIGTKYPEIRICTWVDAYSDEMRCQGRDAVSNASLRHLTIRAFKNQSGACLATEGSIIGIWADQGGMLMSEMSFASWEWERPRYTARHGDRVSVVIQGIRRCWKRD
jgi:hypothetical protein